MEVTRRCGERCCASSNAKEGVGNIRFVTMEGGSKIDNEEE